MRLPLPLPLLLLAVCASGAGLLADPAAAADDGTLEVSVKGLTSSDGNLRFVVFNSRKTFPKRPLHAAVVDIDGEVVTWTVEDLPFGTYAVLVHHDADGSGKMERHWYGKPKEPTGTSNNPPPRMGPPQWKKASFEFAAPTLTIEISLN